MKIMMFSDVYGSVTTTFIRNEVNYFSKNHELIYLAQKISGAPGSIKTYCIPFRENFILRKINWYLWNADLRCSFKNNKYASLLNEFIRKENPDIIHCHFAYEALKLLQNIASDIKVPIFVHFHGYDASQMLRKRSYVKVMTDCLGRRNVFPLAISLKMKQGLENAGIAMGRVEILRYGIDLRVFDGSSEDNKSNEIIFLQISSLEEKKGHAYTLKAFSLFFADNPLMRDRIKVIFAGEGDRKDRLVKLAEDMGLSNVVSFIGRVTTPESVALLKRANVFIHHSVTAPNGDQEGIPNAIIEAMAMKLPVLSSFHAGIPELVQHGVNGLLCKEKDVETYAKQIGEILHWPKLDVNRTAVEASYDLEKHNRQLENMYASKIKLK